MKHPSVLDQWYTIVKGPVVRAIWYNMDGKGGGGGTQGKNPTLRYEIVFSPFLSQTYFY